MEEDQFNSIVKCGQFPMNKPEEPGFLLPQGTGCGASDWASRPRPGGDVNVRILLCKHCGLETAVTYFSPDQDDDDWGKLPSMTSN